MILSCKMQSLSLSLFFQPQSVNLQCIFISPTMPCLAATTTTPKKTFLYLRIFESHIIRWENSWFITQRSRPPVTIFLCHQDQVTLLESEVSLLRALVGVHGNVLWKRETQHMENSWETPSDALQNSLTSGARQKPNLLFITHRNINI